MATTKGGGPGTYTSNGVRCTLDPPFGKAASAARSASPAGGGQMNHNNAPFDKPHDTGNGGLQEKFFDGTGGASATPKAGAGTHETNY